MNKSYESPSPRFLAEDTDTYIAEMQRQQSEAIDRELDAFMHVPESDEVLAMDADPKDKALPTKVKAALVAAARVRSNLQ